MQILFDMEFSIKNCKIIISPLFIAFLSMILLVDKTGIMLFGLLSALIHELGHLIFIFFSKKKISKVSFQLGGVLIDSKGIIDYKYEFLISFGGCLSNFLFFVLFLSLYFNNRNELYLVFSATNFGLFAFNLMPIYGLDGMELTRIILLKRFETTKALFYCKIISFLYLIILSIITLFLFIYKQNVTLLICLLYLIIIMLLFSKNKEH